jgi:hypothetical protein
MTIEGRGSGAVRTPDLIWSVLRPPLIDQGRVLRGAIVERKAPQTAPEAGQAQTRSGGGFTRGLGNRYNFVKKLPADPSRTWLRVPSSRRRVSLDKQDQAQPERTPGQAAALACRSARHRKRGYGRAACVDVEDAFIGREGEAVRSEEIVHQHRDGAEIGRDAEHAREAQVPLLRYERPFGLVK